MPNDGKGNRNHRDHHVGVMLNRIYKTRQEMMRPVFEHPRDYVLLGIREMADRLQVDPATVSRTVTAMGFSTYKEFQRYLHQLSLAHSTAFERMRATGGPGTSIEQRVRETMKGAVRNLEGLCNSLNMRRLEKLADRFYNARRIFLLGGDLAASLVYFLHYQLLVLGFDVSPATSGGHVTHLIHHATRADLVVAISFRRGLRQTVEGIVQARAKGCYTLGITDTAISPIATSAHESLLVSVEVPHFSASYVAPMALLDALLCAIANRRRSRTMAMLKQIEEDQKSSYRWYPQ
jgi:DNA-binding MurR/RpiR family transcriptional regulator